MVVVSAPRVLCQGEFHSLFPDGYFVQSTVRFYTHGVS